MIRVAGWDALDRVAAQARTAGSVVTLGIFDGLHRGHRLLLAHASRIARDEGFAQIHLSFDPHPDLLIRGSVPPRLMDPDELDARLSLAGVDLRCNLPFDERMRDTPWQTFVEQVVRHCGMRALVLSPESAIGARREGSAERIASWGSTHGVVVRTVREARSEEHTSELQSH